VTRQPADERAFTGLDWREKHAGPHACDDDTATD
jgi:hypothetical protein